MITFRHLSYALLKSWSKDTSALPNLWNPDNPSIGQCAVTALIVQNYFGGDIIRQMLSNTSHYWNWLPNGMEVDFTFNQFSDINVTLHFIGKKTLRTRDSILLPYPDTQKRYTLLSERVGHYLTITEALMLGT